MSSNAYTNKNSPRKQINKSPMVRSKKKKLKGILPKSLVQLNLSPCKQIRSNSLCFLRQKFYSLFTKMEQLKHKDNLMVEKQQFRNTIKEFTLSDLCFKAYRSSDKAAIKEYVRSKVHHNSYTQQSNHLSLNNTSQQEVEKDKSQCSLVKAFARRSKYNKRLEPLKASKMSNNIKDYLSVGQIQVKDIEDSIKTKPQLPKRYHLCNFQTKEIIQKSKHSQITQINLSPKPRIPPHNHNTQFFKRCKKFAPPFQTYYYRDFIWKVSYSNNAVIKVPQEYTDKVKAFVGWGNNSNLIKGILRRRTWLQITDRVQDAQFVWTQIKIPPIFQQQPKCQPQKVQQHQQDSPQQKQLISQYQGKYNILNIAERERWKQYWDRSVGIQNRVKQSLATRSKLWRIQQKDVNTKTKVHNHFENNFILGNKKNLLNLLQRFYSLKGINPFEKLPLTFHISGGFQDQQYLKFLQVYHSLQKQKKVNPKHRNVWIVKPGQNSNRGNGIKICLQLSQIKSILRAKQKHRDGTLKTFILQKYIQNPLLYKKRKFDLRHYMMVNCSNGIMKGYWYRKGYVRTTSTEYSLKTNGQGIHLTNDAIQKDLPDYGKYQKSNKITYEQLNSYLSKQDPNFNFFQMVYPKMKQLATDAIHASAFNLDPLRRANNFEVFGLDFMIDEEYNVWLIEVNTNPCLQTNCPVLHHIIPPLIQNTLKICLDPVFPPPLGFNPKSQAFLTNTSEQNNYELIFDERVDKITMIKEGVSHSGHEEQETFDDDGEDFREQY